MDLCQSENPLLKIFFIINSTKKRNIFSKYSLLSAETLPREISQLRCYAIHCMNFTSHQHDRYIGQRTNVPFSDSRNPKVCQMSMSCSDVVVITSWSPGPGQHFPQDALYLQYQYHLHLCTLNFIIPTELSTRGYIHFDTPYERYRS